jgi:hypothetical protein
MSIYRGPFTSLDLNQGVWLDVERDDFGNAKCWMTVDGEEIGITENQYDTLIKGRAEAYRAVAEVERERIIKLIKAYEKDFPLPESWDNIIGIDEVIDLIKGEQE